MPLVGSRASRPIAAIATAEGRGAVALLRVSGPGAGAILLSVCPDLGGELPEPRRQRLLRIVHPETGELIDRALVSWFPRPNSFTGEDTVEIAAHGGVLNPQLVLDALLAAGAEPALPGEFTHRALLNGKMDLLQAEALLDLIDGRSRAMHRAAVNQMERGLSRRIDDLRSSILSVEALAVYGIDFPEEDEPPVPPARIDAAAGVAVERIDALLATADQGETLREGALVVLAGAPNSGKSSLFNALLGVERAIVTELPGTTRDAIEASIELDGYPFRLVDTAGLRSTADRVEELGIEVARRYLGAAQITLFCIEAGREPSSEEREFLQMLQPAAAIVVRTKVDRGAPSPSEELAPFPSCAVSAHTGEGLPALRELLLRHGFGLLRTEPDTAPLITRARHARALRAARHEMSLFRTALAEELPLELAATHLRAAAALLEDLVGVVTPDDVLARVFGEFCVGK